MPARKSENSADLRQWIGRTAQGSDRLRPQAARFMQATLDRTPSLKDGDALPPLWHWLYFLEAGKISELGRDAHAARGGLLPPPALPRRMWAGGRLRFHAPLLLGRDASRQSTVKAITQKQGRSGRLCFVTIAHEIFQDGQSRLAEEHDIVYGEHAAPDAKKNPPAAAPDHADFSRPVTPSEILLFRYSALTFNGHRIHYDADYARDVEGYAGLVFHGPLTATLLLDLACAQTEGTPRTYAYRAVAPIAGMATFHIEGRHAGDAVELWARRQDGALAMSATAQFQEPQG